jgi:very-short-patch-repair endonuclease
VLAVGPDAVLSHRDAAALHGLRSANHPRVDVTTRADIKSTARIAVHRTSMLEPADVKTRDGIPVTTVARTLVDLAAVVSREHLAKALNEAERQRTLDVVALEAAIERTRNRPDPSHARITAVLQEHRQQGTQLTRSELEDRFRALLDRHGIAIPHLNATIQGEEVDALWREHKLVVELDGYAFHHDRRAFQRDREKGNALTAAGYTVLRFTHDDVIRRPAQVAARLDAALAP